MQARLFVVIIGEFLENRLALAPWERKQEVQVVFTIVQQCGVGVTIVDVQDTVVLGQFWIPIFRIGFIHQAVFWQPFDEYV